MDMAIQFFEDGFQYKKYIEEQLLKIDNLEERSRVRAAVEDMLLPFYDTPLLLQYTKRHIHPFQKLKSLLRG